ncbi:MAG: M48 family metalloprotease, partial [Parachlamydia sp.]|nr:M48 family metalloprotease [Parachlamydia sp.]
GGARLAGTEKMISALQTLKRTMELQDPHTAQPAIQALKISSPSNIMRLFASHPPLEERIARLQRLKR